jgi:hypothetical protein
VIKADEIHDLSHLLFMKSRVVAKATPTCFFSSICLISMNMLIICLEEKGHKKFKLMLHFGCFACDQKVKSLLINYFGNLIQSTF